MLIVKINFWHIFSANADLYADLSEEETFETGEAISRKLYGQFAYKRILQNL